MAASPIWHGVDDPVVVLRTDPHPRLAIFGGFTDEAWERLSAYARQIPDAVRHLRYVDHDRATDDAALLAERLREALGDEMSDARFVACPRGGLIVLGMLAYLLDVDWERLRTDAPHDSPLVVVDDCSLSGASLRRLLETTDHPRVVFAHLYSHPDLRAAIESAEPRVEAVIAAHDLDDHGREAFGDAYAEWQRRWLARTTGYWIGYVDHVCFPWTEPDWAGAGSDGSTVDTGWRILPPDLCLKHRGDTAHRTADVQVQPEGPGPLHVASGVVAADTGEEILIAAGASVIGLEGAAAEAWRGLLGSGSSRGAVDALAARYDADLATLTEDVETMVHDLWDRGVLAGGGDIGTTA